MLEYTWKVQEMHLKHRDWVLGTLVRIDWSVSLGRRFSSNLLQRSSNVPARITWEFQTIQAKNEEDWNKKIDI